ncbi:hypothetical protein [Trichloromonas sp.]|uniref:preprotein translocase subunit SecA n=1 Tax=Trichloromonas sp. TaxID=3069249 RepID=UPI003D819D70
MMPSADYRATRAITPGKLHKGLDRCVHDLIGHWRRRDRTLQQLQEQARQIAERSLQHRQRTDAQLRQDLEGYREQFRRRKKDVETFLNEALAVMVEASERTLGMRPYPVQILGALAIHRGFLAEMATGEGKSLTACFPAILAAWSGRPCHLITANDYLASRDAEELAPLYRFCGTTTGWVGGHMDQFERRANYAQGVVYTTGKELLADFLRDRILLGDAHLAPRRQLRRQLNRQHHSLDQLVMRGIDTAIVDEADSVLIDEAVTPLIISQPQKNEPLSQAVRVAATIAQSLAPGEDYRTDRRYREITLTARGQAQIAETTGSLPPLFHGAGRREELVVTALTAREFYHKGQQYVIEDGAVVIVDEFTGRMMPQRTWRQGLHQAVETMEGLPLTDPSETLARLSFQRFFRFFRKIGGMSGTAREAAGELWHIYGLPVLAIPTNRPCRRRVLPSRSYPHQPAKWQAICDEISSCHQAGQPVLIGTRSVASSEELSGMLQERGISHRLLNAVKHKEEAQIIASAGSQGAVTIATNMAGRGADIKLGRGVAELGGLHVILTERHESKRIDRQLYGRCARQGDPGSARAYCSLDDELLQRHGPGALLKIRPRGEASRAEANRFAELLVNLAQRSAQRRAFCQRQIVMQTDDWLTDALSFARTGLD